MKKQLISGIASIAIITNTIGFSFTANAKVIEPEIVKTETWTTSYYIDDDMETLYPYIDCQADIYNDGSLEVSFWNTHEWDGFATVKHTVKMIKSLPYSNNSKEYMFKNHLTYSDEWGEYYSTINDNSNIIDYSIWDSIDLSYYPQEYKYDFNFDPNYYGTSSSDLIYYYYDTSSIRGWHTGRIDTWHESCALPNLSTTHIYKLNFTPKIDIVSTYNFRIFGHDITITPEILSGNIVAEPVITDKEARIQELEEKISNLEEENTKLKSENEQLKNGLITGTFGDIDGNDIIDGRDATMLLTYYAKTSTGYTGTLAEFVAASQDAAATSSNGTGGDINE